MLEDRSALIDRPGGKSGALGDFGHDVPGLHVRIDFGPAATLQTVHPIQATQQQVGAVGPDFEVQSGHLPDEKRSLIRRPALFHADFDRVANREPAAAEQAEFRVPKPQQQEVGTEQALIDVPGDQGACQRRLQWSPLELHPRGEAHFLTVRHGPPASGFPPKLRSPRRGPQASAHPAPPPPAA